MESKRKFEDLKRRISSLEVVGPEFSLMLELLEICQERFDFIGQVFQSQHEINKLLADRLEYLERRLNNDQS